MKKTFFSVIVSVAVSILGAEAAPVDLSSWVAEGSGNWELQPGNDSVLQTLNAQPTVFHNNQNSQGKQLGGKIQVQTAFDDDVIGFVLGYNAGDLTNPSPDYILIDWRQVETPITIGGCDVLPGLSVMRITGDIGDFSGLACRDGSEGVTELARGATLGDVGWEDFREYTFELVFTETLLQVLVDGKVEISLAGTFADGGFGFYNASQGGVLYSGVIEDEAAIRAVPVPAAAPLMAGALLFGRFVIRRRKKRTLID